MSALDLADVAEAMHHAYQEYRDQCFIHGCDCLALTFEQWINL